MGIVFLVFLVGCGSDDVSQRAESKDADLASAEEAIQARQEEAPSGEQMERTTAVVLAVPVEDNAAATESPEASSPDPLLAAVDPVEAFDSKDSADSSAEVGPAVGVKPMVDAQPVVEGPYKAYAEALETLESGDPKEAVSKLESLLDEFTGIADRAKVRANLARAYLKLSGREYSSEHLPKARKWSEEALTMQPESSDVWNVRGRVLLASNRPAEAKQAFRRAIELDSENVHAYNNLGYALILGSEYTEAVTPLLEAQAVAERKGMELPGYVYNNLGIALERSDHLAEAREAFQKAVNAGHPTAGGSLARVESLIPSQKLAEPVEPEKEESEAVVASSPM
jgi:Tfp pilus assembly protein PilF